jgi:hypothetical protein
MAVAVALSLYTYADKSSVDVGVTVASSAIANRADAR